MNKEKNTKKSKKGRKPKPNNYILTTLRVDKDLYKRFKEHCLEKNVSITDELNVAILDFVVNYDKNNGG